jgi:hypothetical protein
MDDGNERNFRRVQGWKTGDSISGIREQHRERMRGVLAHRRGESDKITVPYSAVGGKGVQLVDALVTVANRHHQTWALTVDTVVLLRRSTPKGAAYVVRVLTDPPTQLWTAVIAHPQPGDVVTASLEEALAWLMVRGHRDVLIGDRWQTTAQGAA